MTLPADGANLDEILDLADEGSLDDEIPDLLDVELHQALVDCYKVLDSSPIAALVSAQGWDAGHRLRCLLGAMLTTAGAERRLRDES
jgi:hypothetical protein